jgi:hypothetical protein
MKSIANKTASVSHVVLAQTPGVTDPIPTQSAPSVPEGFVAATKLGRGNRPQRNQIALASKVASELKACADYTQVFGTDSPAASVVADSLTTATGWSNALQNARAWYLYVREQESLAWRHALGLVDPLRANFELRLSRDASVAEALPSTASFLGAAKARAQKGAATRKRKKGADNAGTAASATAKAGAGAAAVVADPVKTAAVKLLN